MYVISIVFETDNIKAVVYGKDYDRVAVKEGGYSSEDNAVANAATLCKSLLCECAIKAEDVEYIGAAVPQGMGALCDVAQALEREVGIKTMAEDMINAKALGEAYAAGDKSSLVMIKIEDTIESGVVIDKKIYAGVAHLGGKLAHMVINFGGYDCACGRKGCFEAYASNGALKRIASEAGVADAEEITAAKLFAKCDSAAEAAKEEYVSYLANAITNVINLFQPQELVLEGSFTEAGDALMKPLMDIVLREQYSRDLPDKCNVRFANTDVDTTSIGAALIGR